MRGRSSHLRAASRHYARRYVSCAVLPHELETQVVPSPPIPDHTPHASLLALLRDRVPSLSAVWIFGSQASGDAGPESDLDVAFLADAPPGAVAIWDLSGEIEDQVGMPVDLVDLRGATTVFQYQVVTKGERVWARDSAVDLYEAFILSERTALEEARRPLLEDIQREGSVHGG